MRWSVLLGGLGEELVEERAGLRGQQPVLGVRRRDVADLDADGGLLEGNGVPGGVADLVAGEVGDGAVQVCGELRLFLEERVAADDPFDRLL